MKKLLTILSLGLSLAFVGKASALTTYDSGVTFSSNLSYSSLLTDGWTQVLNVPYSNHTTFADTQNWLADYSGYEIFVGAVNADGLVFVGGTGLVDDVLKQTYSYDTANAVASSNLYWYNVSGSSFGFSPDSHISLGSADTSGIWTAASGDTNLRLSWHDNFGGWRAGAVGLLNDSTDYNKVVLVAKPGASVPDASSSALLGLFAIGALVGFRRFQRR
jgi:hypothetical protein